MKNSNFLNIAAIAAALLAAVLMGPFLMSSNSLGRWSIFVLATISAWLILGGAPEGKQQRSMLAYSAILGGLLLVAGNISEIDKLQYVSAIILLSGTIGHFCRLSPKATLLILFCFLSTLPLPAGMETSISVWLAEREAALFVAFGQTLGMALYQLGPQVIMGEQAVTINSDCSGTLLLIPSFIGCLTASIQYRGSLLEKTAITLAAFPLAFAINVIRLAILVIANFTLTADVTDNLHDIAGWVAMPIAWAAPIIWVNIYGSLQEPDLKISYNFTIVMLGVSIIAAASHTLTNVLTKSTVETPVSIPLYVAGWIGKNEAIPEAEAKILSADQAVRRLYTSPDNDRSLLVTTMFHRDPRVAAEHSSEKCYKAMGWQTKQVKRETLAPGVQITHLIVRNHTIIQAVTEITVQPSAITTEHEKGALRLQVVETSSIPLKKRQQTALDFLKKTPTQWSTL
ncbi:exosortase-associated EpsI family protein [Kordiimonas aquimaris]|uniref:exosortase-associated EpsI family protein n=1 Tax=Kordiimonas aquimaris TaxID=707591 RepID=UPI0021D0BA40|nr:exosortase-associated EpsI family protein [Kordiimonas aquimaris]